MRVAPVDSRLLPTDNDWGVPALNLEMQATQVQAPVFAWGTVARSACPGGTWCFYVDDYRFGAPNLADTIVASGCAAIVEPNYSLFDWTPRAEVLAATYRKRRIARLCQDAGVRVIVDLCTPQEHRELCMMGVPRGWQAFATRGFEARLNDLRLEHLVAMMWSNGRGWLMVYGGGRKVRALCGELGNCIHVADHMATMRAASRSQEQPSNGKR